MNVQRIAALAGKELREIVRDRIFLLLAFLMPLLLMLVFCHGLGQDVRNIPFAIVDYDRSALSRDYAHHFIDSAYFDFRGYLPGLREADDLLVKGEVRAVIVIPERFGQRLLEGRESPVQTLLDGTFTNAVRTTRSYIETIDAEASGALRTAFLARRGVTTGRAQAMQQPIRLEVRYLYNEELSTIWAIAPSLIMFILTLTTPLLTALGVVRERETGSIYNVYASTVRRGEFLAGKLLPYILISMMDAFLLWLMAVALFRAPCRGSIGFFFFATLIYLVCTGGIGLLISLAVRTQQAALLISVMLSVILATQFAGMFTPVSSLTGATYVVAHLTPAMYFNNIIEGVFLKGMGLAGLWKDTVALALYSTIVLALAHHLFRKRTAA